MGLNNFNLGFNLGLTLPIVFIMFYMIAVMDDSTYTNFSSVVIAYRMIGMALLMAWGWGFDLYFWSKYRVNYVFIFEFNARQHIRFQQLLAAASLFTIVWVVSFFLYLVCSVKPPGFEWLGKIPWQLHPLILICLTFGVLAYHQYKSQFWLAKTLLRIVTTPFSRVAFRDVYLADQLSSIVIVMYDLEYTICYFLSDAWTGDGEVLKLLTTTDVCHQANRVFQPIIAAMPVTWRLLQCLRRYRDTKDWAQLVNAGKYGTGFFVVITSIMKNNFRDFGFLMLWILAITASTIYTFLWDLKKDWGLGQREHKFLRSKLLYGSPNFYYVCIAGNFVMRLMWTLTISPSEMGILLDPMIFATVLASVEIFRRALWNLFRLENEQLSNVDKFKAINISVPPPLLSISSRQYMKQEMKKKKQKEEEDDDEEERHTDED